MHHIGWADDDSLGTWSGRISRSGVIVAVGAGDVERVRTFVDSSSLPIRVELCPNVFEGRDDGVSAAEETGRDPRRPRYEGWLGMEIRWYLRILFGS